MTLTLTQKIHVQRIRKNLLVGYPPDSGMEIVLSRISDEELLRMERESHAEKVAWLKARQTRRHLSKIMRRAVQHVV